MDSRLAIALRYFYGEMVEDWSASQFLAAPLREAVSWPSVVVAVLGALLAFVGGWVGTRADRRAHDQADVWRRREETMRMLRWAVEQAASENEYASSAGFAALAGLQASELLQPQDVDLVLCVAEALLGGTLASERAEQAERVRREAP